MPLFGCLEYYSENMNYSCSLSSNYLKYTLECLQKCLPDFGQLQQPRAGEKFSVRGFMQTSSIEAGATERVKLSAVARILAQETGRKPPTYRQIYTAVVDGSVPAEKAPRDYYVRRADLPQIAEFFGLQMIASTK
jgi:hypothetical protein